MIIPTLLAHASEVPGLEELTDKLMDKLVDRIFASSSSDEDLDGTTLAKTHPGMKTLPNMQAGSLLGKALISPSSASPMAARSTRMRCEAATCSPLLLLHLNRLWSVARHTPKA